MRVVPAEGKSSQESLVKLAAARDEVELALWRDVLEQEGIPIMVKNVDALAISYYSPPSPYSFEVYVRAKDERRARWLLGLLAED